MTIKERYEGIISRFREIMPSPQTELNYDTPFHLLLAVILSAQCTDKRVNIISPPLFEAYPNAASLAAAEPEEVFAYIKSVTFPHNKSRHLVNAARKLVADFGGEVPGDIDSLVTIPGVGRKTANVMLAVVWGKAAMPVDTHVFRVSRRLGLARNCTTPLAVEKALVRHIDPEMLPDAHHWLILHGRYVCKARKPMCGECPVSDFCLEHSQKNSAE